MMGIPISWVLGLVTIGSIASYILYLKWQRDRAERKAKQAIQERNNAVVEQHATETALDAQDAYQQAYDKASSEERRDESQRDEARPKSLLQKMNNLSPLLLCLLMMGCSSTPKVIEVNPAEKVVIPSAAHLEHWQFTESQPGAYCMDTRNAEMLYRNLTKRKARTAGLEAMLLKLGAKKP